MWTSPIERILNVRVLGARPGTKYQCLRLTDVSLNFDNDQSRAAVFWTSKNHVILPGTLAWYIGYRK